MLKCAGLDTINSITYICRQSLKKRVENQESELPGSAGKTMWPSMDAMDMSGLLKKWGLFSYPLKRTKQETYFRKHSDVYFCCSYIRMTTPGSGLLSRWIIFFFNEMACVTFYYYSCVFIYTQNYCIGYKPTQPLLCKWTANGRIKVDTNKI